jgi:hypothetical protein
VRQQSRSFAHENPQLRPQPQLQPALLRLSAMISHYFICADSDFAMI